MHSPIPTPTPTPENQSPDIDFIQALPAVSTMLLGIVLDARELSCTVIELTPCHGGQQQPSQQIHERQSYTQYNALAVDTVKTGEGLGPLVTTSIMVLNGASALLVLKTKVPTEEEKWAGLGSPCTVTLRKEEASPGVWLSLLPKLLWKCQPQVYLHPLVS